MLVVVTFRPGFVPPWAGHGHVTTAVARPPRTAARRRRWSTELAGGGEALPAEVVARILDRADGVPLFLEELTRAVLDSATAQDGATSVPATLQGSLLAQLDRLAEAKEVAQLGAVIGREFPRDLLAAVAATPEAELRHALGRLVEAGLLHETVQSGARPTRSGTPWSATPPTRACSRAAGASFTPACRATLGAGFPRTVADEPELLAHHLRRGRAGRAGRSGTVAGRASAPCGASPTPRRSAITGRRLRLLAALPAGPERDRTELLTQTALGVPLMATKGYSAPEVRRAYARARELCRGIGPHGPALFPVLFGLCLYYLGKPDLPAAVRSPRDASRRREPPGTTTCCWKACGVAGAAALYRRQAGRRAQRSSSAASPSTGRNATGDHAARYGHDPLAALAFVARVHALLGRSGPGAAARRGPPGRAPARPPRSPTASPRCTPTWRMLHLVLRDAPAALRPRRGGGRVASGQDSRCGWAWAGCTAARRWSRVGLADENRAAGGRGHRRGPGGPGGLPGDRRRPRRADLPLLVRGGPRPTGRTGGSRFAAAGRGAAGHRRHR